MTLENQCNLEKRIQNIALFKPPVHRDNLGQGAHFKNKQIKEIMSSKASLSWRLGKFFLGTKWSALLKIHFSSRVLFIYLEIAPFPLKNE